MTGGQRAEAIESIVRSELGEGSILNRKKKRMLLSLVMKLFKGVTD